MTETFKPECQSIHEGVKSPDKEGKLGSDLRAQYYQLCGCYHKHSEKLRNRKQKKNLSPTGMDILAQKPESQWCEQDLTQSPTKGKCFIPDNTKYNDGDYINFNELDIINCANKSDKCSTALNTYHTTCIENSDTGHSHFKDRTNKMNKKWQFLKKDLFKSYLPSLYGANSKLTQNRGEK